MDNEILEKEILEKEIKEIKHFIKLILISMEIGIVILSIWFIIQLFW